MHSDQLEELFLSEGFPAIVAELADLCYKTAKNYELSDSIERRTFAHLWHQRARVLEALSDRTTAKVIPQQLADLTETEKRDAIDTVKRLLDACGPQTMQQILRELHDQTIGVNSREDAHRFAGYALDHFRTTGELDEKAAAEDEETAYDLI